MVKALLFGMPDISSRFNLIISVPNLGITSLAGNVDPSVCDIKVADLLQVSNNWQNYVLNALKEYSPDLVGISFMSFQYKTAIKLSKIIKDYNKNIKIVMGGYHPTLMYDEMPNIPDFQDIDFIIRGEGEATFSELVNALNNGTGFENINGLSYKNKDGFHHNPPRELLDLNTIKFPNRDARLIKTGFKAFDLPSDAVETSRGCTYKCKFCSISKMYGRNFRTYELDRVIADIKNTQKYGAKAIFIIDDNVTLDINRFEELCEEIISAKLNKVHYLIQASVKGIAHSEKLAQKMADAGIGTVFMGIESVKTDKLEYLNKKSTTYDETKKAVKYLRDNNIIVSGGFITGMPDDDKKSMKDVFDIAWELKLDLPIFFILIPHLKTEIRDELLADGLITNLDDYSKYEGVESANVRTKYLSSKDLERITNKMYFDYIVNYKYFIFNQVRKNYPKYFWFKSLSLIPSVIKDMINMHKTKKESLIS